MLQGSGGGRGILNPRGLSDPNCFQDFLTNPTLTQNNRKYQMIENAENPDVGRVFGVLSFQKSKTPSGARISASKTISKDFLEKVLDKFDPTRPVAVHIISAKSAVKDQVISIIIPQSRREFKDNAYFCFLPPLFYKKVYIKEYNNC